MPYAQESGYIPSSIETILQNIMVNINTQFSTSYTWETFQGSNHYKFCYAVAQILQENETKTSEIYAKLQQYILVTNQRISNPVTTPPGLIFQLLEGGFLASVKPIIEADAGKISVCVDVNKGEQATGTVTITNFANLISGTDDSITVGGVTFTAQTGAATPGTGTFRADGSNNATALSLATQINAHATTKEIVRATATGAAVLIKAWYGGTDGNSIGVSYTDNDSNVGATLSGLSGGNLSGGTDADDFAADSEVIGEILAASTAAGTVTQGPEVQAVVISNGQSFDYKFFLPKKYEVMLKLTLTTSENNDQIIGDPDDTKLALIENINEKYALGKNFEPQRYFSILDAPWCASVLLEYSIDGGATYASSIYDSLFDEFFDCSLDRIELVEV